MSIADLTGTTWTFNSSLSLSPISSMSTNFAVNFSSNGNNYTQIMVAANKGMTAISTVDYSSPLTSAYSNGSWYNEAFRTIEITGGSGATNATLISWIESNATQVVPSHAVTISYNGADIATMDASGVKTLLTGSMFCEDDIIVTYTAPSAPTPTLQAKTNITPTTSSQTITPDTGYDGLSSVQINAMPSGSATTPATTITANPSISVSNGGLITATASASQSITPTVIAGYVSSGTAGTVTVSGSNTQQLTAKSEATYTPTTTAQTIASGQYLTGAQTIAGDANLLAENIKKDVSIFSVVGTYEGTASGPYVVGIVENSYLAVDSVINNAGVTVTVSYTKTTTMPLPPMSQLVVAKPDGTPLIVLKSGGSFKSGDTFTFTMPSESVVVMISGGL